MSDAPSSCYSASTVAVRVVADKATLMPPSRSTQHTSKSGSINSSPSPPAQQFSGVIGREYEFFVTTDEPHQPDGPERDRIRRLVMRNFFKTKWSNPTNNSSEHSSASTVQANKCLKSRFRLLELGQYAEPKTKTETSAIRDSKDEEKRAKKEKRARTSIKPPKTYRYDAASQNRAINRGRSGSGMVETECTGIDPAASYPKPPLLLKANPNADRFDPFDVLPVEGSRQLDILFKLYKSGSRVNSIAINAGNTWWKFVSSDAGMLHATLATWALYGMLVRGLDDLRMDKLRHKNEAIKEINTKISSPKGSISDELVGTVLTLASFENLLGAYDAAQLHIAALKRMINARGGLSAFIHNDGLLRGLIWVDFHTATAFHTSPTFPPLLFSGSSSPPPLPSALLESAAVTSPTSTLNLPLFPIDIFNIFYRLHRLALAVSPNFLPTVSRFTLSTLLYECEYTILSIPDASRTFLDFDRDIQRGAIEQDENRTDPDWDQRKRNADESSMLEAILAAAQVFLFAALRHVPLNTEIFRILLDRLRRALDRPPSSPPSPPANHAAFTPLTLFCIARNQSLLVWILLVGSRVAYIQSECTWWTMHLALALHGTDITSLSAFETEMRKVAWTDAFFRGDSEGDTVDVFVKVWQDVEGYLEEVGGGEGGPLGRENGSAQRPGEHERFIFVG